MRVSWRVFKNSAGKVTARHLLLVSESQEESAIIDQVFGTKVDDGGKVGDTLKATCHLADGYGKHYIRIEGEV